VLDEREDDPAGDAVLRPGDARPRELLVDDELFERLRGPAPRLGPVRLHVAGVDQLRALLGRRERGKLLGDRARRHAQCFGFGREVEPELAGRAREAEGGDIPGRGLRVEQRDQRGRAAQQHVAVVFPGEADATVHLDVELGVAEERGHRLHRRDSRGERELVAAALGRARRVPHRGGAELRCHEHVGAVVLDRLEHRDRATELLALLGVRRRALDALLRTARGFGGRERAGHIARERSGSSEHAIGRDRHVAGHDAADPAGRVEVAGDRDGQSRGVTVQDNDVVAGDEHEQLRESCPEHRTAVAGHGRAVEGQPATEAERGDPAAIGEAREQRSPLRVGTRHRDHSGRHHRREERAGRDRAPELLEHDDELRQAVPAAAHILGEVQPEPAELAELVPELRELFGRRVEQGARRSTRVDILEERARDALELAVGVGQGDRHGRTVPFSGSRSQTRPGISSSSSSRRGATG
jgi:hypothetical protein